VGKKKDANFNKKASEFFWFEYAKRHAFLNHHEEFEEAKSLYNNCIQELSDGKSQTLLDIQYSLYSFPYFQFKAPSDEDDFIDIYRDYPSQYSKKLEKEMLRYRELSQPLLKKYRRVADVYFFTEFEIDKILIDYLNSGDDEKDTVNKKGEYFPNTPFLSEESRDNNNSDSQMVPQTSPPVFRKPSLLWWGEYYHKENFVKWIEELKMTGLEDTRSKKAMDSMSGMRTADAKIIYMANFFNNPDFTIKGAIEQFTSMIFTYVESCYQNNAISPKEFQSIIADAKKPHEEEPGPDVIHGFSKKQIIRGLIGLWLWDGLHKKKEPEKVAFSKLRAKLQQKTKDSSRFQRPPANCYENTKAFIEVFDPSPTL